MDTTEKHPLRAVAGYEATDHERNEDVRQQLGTLIDLLSDLT